MSGKEIAEKHPLILSERKEQLIADIEAYVAESVKQARREQTLADCRAAAVPDWHTWRGREASSAVIERIKAAWLAAHGTELGGGE